MMRNKFKNLIGLGTLAVCLGGCGGTNPGNAVSTTSEIKVSPESDDPPYTVVNDAPGTLSGIYDPHSPSTGSTSSQRFTLPKSMAALGDSISAGFLANLKRGGYLYSEQIFRELDLAYRLFRSGSDEDQALKALEKKGWSWTTGLDSGDVIKSHAYRLKKMRGSLKVYNAAVSGSEAKDVLDKQLDKVLSWSRKELGQGAPDYVTVMIGPNDICDPKISGMTPTADYQNRVSQVVGTLLAAEKKTRILISSIPNIEPLRRTAKNARAFIGDDFRCEDLWKKIDLCPNLTLDDDKDHRRQIAQRVVEYNESLKKITSDYARIYGDRVRYGSSVYDYRFTTDDLSVDCFHPNPRSQNVIADRNFDASWWKADWKDYKNSHYNEQ